MKEDFLFLKSKGDKFLELAGVTMEREHYDLAALHLEQAIQLYLKFKIGDILGDFPRTHDLEELFFALDKVMKEENIMKLVEENKEVINDLYKSYFDSRYFDKPFTRSQVERMKNFVLKTKNLLQL